jgi:uncharacterized protein (TIGR02594 family)
MTFEEWLISRLRAHGAYAGVMDGVYGRSLIDALARFQRAEGLKINGKADEETVKALRRAANSLDDSADTETVPSIPAEPVWMREARRFVGLREIPGSQSNPTIVGWANALGGWVAGFFKNDDIAWCGLFIGHVIAATLPREPLPKNPLGALEWNKLGRRLTIPVLGAILTFTRSGGGHVGIYVGEDATHYHVLGGNQSNSVSITRIEKSRLSAIRWPATGDEPRGGKVILTAAGVAVSKNEA